MEQEYVIRTDLAQGNNLKKRSSYTLKDFKIRLFYQDKINYTNIEFKNVENKERKRELAQVLAHELKKYLKKYQIGAKAKVLTVGLGNKNVLSDSLGVKSVEKVLAQGFLKKLMGAKIREVYTFIPGVYEQTGYESFVGVKALVKELKPELIIVVDSLVCSRIEDLNQVVQISDNGITPGSGINNYQEELSLTTLGVPVIVIGVPTVTFASTIIKDALNLKEETIKFQQGYDLVVSSKDIDLIIKNLSQVISDSLNLVLNNISIW